jgi:hypothetical protein
VTAPGGAHDIALNIGTSLKLTAVAKNAAGGVIAGAGPFSFTSRKPSIVTVDTAGVITSVGLGSTYVVVTLPSGAQTLMDSDAVAVGTTTSTKVSPSSE